MGELLRRIDVAGPFTKKLLGVAALAALASLLMLCLGSGPAPAKVKLKYHVVPLERMLSVSTKTVEVNGTLFRYAWGSDLHGTSISKVVRFNRTSCREFRFSAANNQHSGYDVDGRPEIVAVVEGLAPQVWAIPVNTVSLSPPFKVRPGAAALIKVRGTNRDGASKVYLNGGASCKTRTGKLR